MRARVGLFERAVHASKNGQDDVAMKGQDAPLANGSVCGTIEPGLVNYGLEACLIEEGEGTCDHRRCLRLCGGATGMVAECKRSFAR